MTTLHSDPAAVVLRAPIGIHTELLMLGDNASAVVPDLLLLGPSASIQPDPNDSVHFVHPSATQIARALLLQPHSDLSLNVDEPSVIGESPPVFLAFGNGDLLGLDQLLTI